MSAISDIKSEQKVMYIGYYLTYLHNFFSEQGTIKTEQKIKYLSEFSTDLHQTFRRGPFSEL